MRDNERNNIAITRAFALASLVLNSN